MLYIHIPFCNRKCFYCGFVSINNKAIWENYFEKLIDELKQRANQKQVTSIYFGGGTPSIVDTKYIENCIKIINEYYNVSKDAEITIEANPTKEFADKIHLYKQIGFNRLSFGLQSLCEEKTKKLGRIQNPIEALDCIKKGVNLFDNVSVDLLIGLENQTKKELIDTINILHNVGVKHYSIYMLMIEDDTILKDIVDKNLYKPLDESESVQLYETAFKQLKSLGIDRYETSNFCLPNYFSRHNLGYWQMTEYLGFGVSAHSFQNKIRSYNSNEIHKYISDNIVETEKLCDNEINEERIMLGLRTSYGVKKDFIKNKIELEKLLELGVIKNKNENIVICDDYFAVANQIILKLI